MMPTRARTDAAELRRVLQDLAMASSGASRLIRNNGKRRWLQRALRQAIAVLKADCSPPPCAECLRRAAAEADTERAAQPGYRADLEG